MLLTESGWLINNKFAMEKPRDSAKLDDATQAVLDKVKFRDAS